MRPFLVALTCTLVVVPFPEILLWNHHVLGTDRVPPFLVAYAISLTQMLGEYRLLGIAESRFGSVIVQWWSKRGKAVKTSGYAGVFLTSAAPWSTRLAGVALWRTANLKGAGWVLAAGTLVRLAVVYTSMLRLQQ